MASKTLNASQQRVVDAAKAGKKGAKRSKAMWLVIAVATALTVVGYVFYDKLMSAF